MKSLPRVFVLIVIVFQLFGSRSAIGSVPSKAKNLEFLNLKCKATQSCSLKSFHLTVADYTIRLNEFDEEHITTKMIASYETSSVADLEDYSIVQFIKGCRFESKLVDDVVQKSIFIQRTKSFGAQTIFRFPVWTIDSDDTNPIYNSDVGSAGGQDELHRLYRWNTVKGSFENKTQKLYGKEKPTEPLLYVKDMLSSAYYVNSNGIYLGTAFNNSLQFKTCIFKTKDIPKETRATNVNFAKPIHCFSWSSSQVFNHRTGSFESPRQIDKYCLQK